MKPAPFAYRRPDTTEEALSLLAEHGDDATILAGGQSLMPLLNFRMVQPALLIDINRIPELRTIRTGEAGSTVGAVTRYVELQRDAGIARHAPLLPLALPLVAHAGVRNRGTIGGSIALADPAAEMPACALCMDAEIELASLAGGTRKVPGADFFQDIYTTDAREDELVVAIHFPAPDPNRRFAIREIAPRHGDFAMAGLAASATAIGGRLRDVRLVFFAIGDRPTRAFTAERHLDANLPDGRQAAIEALDADLEFRSDPRLDAGHRRTLCRTLLARVLADLNGESPHV